MFPRLGTFDSGYELQIAGRRVPLLRAKGMVAVRLRNPKAEDAVAERLTGRDAVLKEFRLTKSGGGIGLLIFDAKADGDPLDAARLPAMDLESADRMIATLERDRDIAAATPVFFTEPDRVPQILTDEVIVRTRADASVSQLERDLGSARIVRRVAGTKDQFVLRVPGVNWTMALDLVRDLSRRAYIEWVEPNWIVAAHTNLIPNDPLYFPNQWHLINFGQNNARVDADVDAPEAWNVTTGSASTIVAVLDDAVETTHPDLQPNLAVNTGEIPANGWDDDMNGYFDDVCGWDFSPQNYPAIGGDPNPNPTLPTDNHGTAVAGVAVAAGNNFLGGVGSAFGCRLLPIRVLHNGFININGMAEAIRYAAGSALPPGGTWRGADVLNLSFTTSQHNVIDAAFDWAENTARDGKGVPVFCSTGNGASGFRGPAGEDSTLTWNVTPGTWYFEWRYSTDGTISDGDNTAWISYVELPDGTIERFDAPGAPAGWNMSPDGDPGWTIEDDPAHAYGVGRYVAKAGAIGHNAVTKMRTYNVNVTTAGQVRYRAWVSSEATHDKLEFYARNLTTGVTSGPFNPQSGVLSRPTAPGYPASYPSTIAVGASTDWDYRSDYSQYGQKLDFVAPSSGGFAGITTTDRQGANGYDAASDYTTFGGTSSASPLAAGIAALLLSQRPMTASQVRQVLRNTCDKIGPVAYVGGRNDYYGYGRLNANAALALPVSINWFNDCFPVNPTSQVPTPINPNGFDTTAAVIRTGLNISRPTGGVGANGRHNVPGDSVITEWPGNDVRVDLVFRILPGVGNYVTVGNRASGLVHRPSTSGADRSAAGNVAAAGDSSFWGQYMANNGVVGTGGDGNTGPGHTGNLAATSGWDANRWNSARCDTAELNLFPRLSFNLTSFNPNAGRLKAGTYCSQYHESDPKFFRLGIRKNRCVLQPQSAPPLLVEDHRFIRCGPSKPVDFLGSDAAYPGAEYVAPGSGMASNEIGNPASVGRTGPPGNFGETYEYTQIIPDGLLTPGSHVEYFIRKSPASAPMTSVRMVPDTARVVPQFGEGDLDGHRWQQFGVLPDRWKDPAFPYGGQGMATMLVVDMDDGSGEERAWTAVADTIGLTCVPRWGAHNGWKARGDQVISDVDVGTNDQISVRAHLGQAGTRYDLYQVRGGQSLSSAGHLGSRYANEVNPGLEAGKFSRHGPSDDMLRAYYRHILLLGGGVGCVALGPLTDLRDDDRGLLQNFFVVFPGTAQPRSSHAIGNNLVEGQATCGDPGFFQTYFRATLRDENYRNFSGNVADVADLLPQAPMGQGIYGVNNDARSSNDVLNVVNDAPPGQEGAQYQNVGPNGPYTAGVYAPDVAGPRPYRTLVEGWRIGRTMGSQFTLARLGMHQYWSTLMTNFGPMVGAPCHGVIGVGDDASAANPIMNFLALRSRNPSTSGGARIGFGLTRTENVEIRIFDVGGRVVRTLANRIFAGGVEHFVIWNGETDGGHRAAPGVYFYQIRTPSFVSQKKLTLLTR